MRLRRKGKKLRYSRRRVAHRGELILRAALKSDLGGPLPRDRKIAIKFAEMADAADNLRRLLHDRETTITRLREALSTAQRLIGEIQRIPPDDVIPF